ncbi:MAG TPA: lipid A-modifier LpxR family protein [Chitinophagaceae bacterium]|nr:lipid A-modifier LpxR family protein [Chitinophagaceae bacterium]
MKQKLLLAAIVFFIANTLFSQKGRTDYLYEFRATSDNDNYALTFNDGYYTNGLFLQFNKAATRKTNQRPEKIVSSWRLGQMIFNSQNYDDKSLQTIDRPLSGYLFVEKGFGFFYKKGHILQSGLAIGGTGKSSYAKEVQSWYHQVAGLPATAGWPFQLNGEASLNLSAAYKYNLLGIKKKRSNFEIMGIASGNLGNAFTNISGGMMLKFGNFEDPLRSSFFNARVGRGTGDKLKRNAEVFIYFYPQLVQQFYNATVQGPLFRSDKGPLVSDIVRQVYQHRMGIHYAERSWTLDLNYVMKNREAESMKQKEKYASITLAYRFGRIK